QTAVTVEAQGSDLVETESTPHTDIDRGLFEKLPLESASSSVSSLITLASPGAVADSNGLVHGIGDHAENSFSVDGQPITDQQNVFDRIDLQPREADIVHLNIGYTRSSFLTPHSFDAAALDEDQHALINTYNIAPSWTHIFGSSKLLNLGAYIRHDGFHYFPSADPFADQPETL